MSTGFAIGAKLSHARNILTQKSSIQGPFLDTMGVNAITASLYDRQESMSPSPRSPASKSPFIMIKGSQDIV